jgi:ACS family hexuronate transporter-like MFS transporter
VSVFTSVIQEVKALSTRGKGKLLVVIATGWGLLNGMRAVYPILLPYLRESFGFSLSVGGLLISVLWLGSAVGQLPGGILADRYSERLVMTASTLLVATGLLVVVTASSLFILFAATGLVGIGQSLYPIARITSLSAIYPNRIGSALGVTMATGDLGQTVLPPIAVVLAGAAAWQAGLGFLSPLLLLAGIVIWITLPSREKANSIQNTVSGDQFRLISRELQEPNMVFMGFILFLYIFIWQSFTGLYPTYLIEEKGLSSPVASVLFSLFFALGVLVKPFAGTTYDRIGMRGTLIIVLIGPVAGFLLLPFIDNFWLLVVATVLVSSMLGSGAVTQSYLAEVFPDELQGSGLGAVRTTAAILGASGPVLFGAMAERGYFDEGYIVLAVIIVGIILLTIRIPDTERT